MRPFLKINSNLTAATILMYLLDKAGFMFCVFYNKTPVEFIGSFTICLYTW